MFVSGHAMHTWAAMTWVRGRESLVTLGSIARAARGATEIAAGRRNERTNARKSKIGSGRNPDAGCDDAMLDGQTNDRRYVQRR